MRPPDAQRGTRNSRRNPRPQVANQSAARTTFRNTSQHTQTAKRTQKVSWMLLLPFNPNGLCRGQEKSQLSRRSWSCRRHRLSSRPPEQVCTCRSTAISIQSAMSMVTAGMSSPRVMHQLQVMRVARYVLENPTEKCVSGHLKDPKRIFTCAPTRTGRRARPPGSQCHAQWSTEAQLCPSSVDSEFDGRVRDCCHFATYFTDLGTGWYKGGGDNRFR